LVATDAIAVPLVGQLRELLSKGGFRLTKWVSNSKKIMNSLPESERAPSVKNLNLAENAQLTERALGVQWNVHADTFSFKIANKEKTRYWKRNPVNHLFCIRSTGVR